MDVKGLTISHVKSHLQVGLNLLNTKLAIAFIDLGILIEVFSLLHKKPDVQKHERSFLQTRYQTFFI